ncbi:MAG TPA: reverse transcriptase/maturase family protein [Candidatus Saccharimonadales bacterium]|nr:reverse transcriptase/maturase family protein [Candidatus Saccharimonadales bacterium]
MAIEIDYATTYGAWRRFRKSKRPSRAIDEFAYNLEANIERLADALTAGTYRHGDYQKVVLQEKKRRDLAVAGVPDRVVHRLLYDYLVNIYDKSFDPDVWSCRAGKGLHKCFARTQQLLGRYRDSFVWRADITKFFDSVDHGRLMACLARKLEPADPALWLCEEVIKSYHLNGAGIPIGNLTSQIFANIYLQEFDRFVRHQVKPQAYLRYGDDFLLFVPTRRQAYLAHGAATDFLRNDLKLRINPKNDVVVPARDGLKFLGHVVTDTFLAVDKHTTRLILERVAPRNVSSYRALPLVAEAKDQLDWLLLEKFDI